VLDIGANTGFYTLLACAANPKARVTAFEPVPATIEALRSNIALNGFEGRCQTVSCAVADAVGRAAFHVPFGTTPDMASLGRTGWLGIAGEVTEVATTTIDAAVGHSGHLDLVKVDVEGHEDVVLKGGLRTLDACRPALILECNPEGPYRMVEEILLEHDYDIYHLRTEGVLPVKTIRPDRRDDPDRGRNFLAYPSEQPLPSFD